jgi:hypothetical protein
MSVPVEIRIQIVLLMVKFESPIVMEGKAQVELGAGCIIDTFQCFR